MRLIDDCDAPATAGDPSFESELIERLRGLDWPKPPEGLKERCLEELLAQVAEQESEGAAEEAPGFRPRAVPDQPPTRDVGRPAHGRVDRHAVTWRQVASPRATLPAPRRPVRLAAVL